MSVKVPRIQVKLVIDMFFTTLCDLYVVQQCKITVEKSERPADERVCLTSFNGELNKTL